MVGRGGWVGSLAGSDELYLTTRKTTLLLKVTSVSSRAQFVVFSINGFFAASVSIMGCIPKMHTGL